MERVMNVFSTLPFSSLAGSAHPGNDRIMHDNDYGHMMDWWQGGGVGWAMWIILALLVGITVYLVIYVSREKQGGKPSSETPLEILKKRYARGEISKEEFNEIKDDLN
jgi:putative membrane protein